MAFTEIDGRKVYLPGRNFRGYNAEAAKAVCAAIRVHSVVKPRPLVTKSGMSDGEQVKRYIAAMIDRYPWKQTHPVKLDPPTWGAVQWAYTGKGKHKGTARYIAHPRVVPNIEQERIAA